MTIIQRNDGSDDYLNVDREAGGVLSLQMFTRLFIFCLTLFVSHAGESVVLVEDSELANSQSSSS